MNLMKGNAMKGWPGESKLNIPFNEVIAYDAAAAHARQPIANVIFDFGNVLVDWDPQALFMPRYSEKLYRGFSRQ